MASKDNKQKDNNMADSILAAAESGLQPILDFFAFLGMFSLYIGNSIKKVANAFYVKYIRRYVFKLDALGLKLVKFFSKITRATSFKFYMFAKFFVDAKSVVVGGYNKEATASTAKKLFNSVKAFARGVINNRSIFITTINYALPVIAISVFVSLVSYVSTLNFAVSVEYNGEHIGYVENETVFESAETKLQERMTYLEDDETINSIPKFSLVVVDGEPLKTDTEMTDTIIQSSSGDIVKATGLYIDGEFYGAVKEGETLQTELNQILAKYETNSEEEEVNFAKEVTFDPGFFMAKNIVEEASVIATVTKQEQKDVYYEVVSGDTPILIAQKNDMELDDVVALNNDILTNCMIGKQVLVQKSQSFLPVKVTRTEHYTKEIPFSVSYAESNTLFSGTQKITKAGVAGKEAITAKVDYIDGSEVARTVIASSQMSEPVTQIVTKGTKEMPRVSGFSGKVSNSGFVWPVYGGYISQYYKGSGHNGIDYAFRGNGYGVPVVAALPGTVTFAGKNASYGNLVKIVSPGGIETWYAHNSKLRVSVGESVEQGQQVANVGSTGRSTGNHLHFRVIVNGVQKDPMNYLP